MRPEAWLVAALLLPFAAEAAPPEGCEALDESTFSCRWTFSPTPVAPSALWPIPVFALTLATVDVTLLTAYDSGWDIAILEEGRSPVSFETHPANATPAMRHHAKSTHVIATNESVSYALAVTPGPGTPATARFEVAFLARLVPEGVAPSRPAATAADPHLLDEPNETSEPAWDLRAAWLDDARLDDGLFDAHVLVADLTALGPTAFQAPALGPLAPFDPAGALSWKLSWTVQGSPYFVEWIVTSDAPDRFHCFLYREAQGAGGQDVVAAVPLCEADVATGTLHATIPIGAIGSPPDGALFEDLAARTRIPYGATTDVVDDATYPRYHFALGGPAVWSALNDRLDPPPGPAWYQDPFAPENAADTLQIVGTFAALATFLVGLLLVWRRRRHTSRLLARIDAVEDAGVDAPNVLLALGRLEQEFAVLFRRHRISEAQYQVLSQRIATVATRHALRRQLGLDDGVPGAPVDAPPAEGATRLRVR